MKGTPGLWFDRIVHKMTRSHHISSHTEREMGLLSQSNAVFCCTSLFDQYEIQLPIWSSNVPTCDLLSTTKPLKQVRWRKFCCKHTSTIYSDSKIRRDNRRPSATHSAEENSTHAKCKREWARVLVRSDSGNLHEPARPVLTTGDDWDAKGFGTGG